MSRDWVAREPRFEGGEEGSCIHMSLRLVKQSDPPKQHFIYFKVPFSDQGFCGYKVDKMDQLFLRAFESTRADTILFVIVFP